jgi:hypothetical protein
MDNGPVIAAPHDRAHRTQEAHHPVFAFGAIWDGPATLIRYLLATSRLYRISPVRRRSSFCRPSRSNRAGHSCHCTHIPLYGFETTDSLKAGGIV